MNQEVERRYYPLGMFSFLLLCYKRSLWWPLSVGFGSEHRRKRSTSNQWVWGWSLVHSVNMLSVLDVECATVHRWVSVCAGDWIGTYNKPKCLFPHISRLFRRILAHNDFLDFVQAAVKQLLLNFILSTTHSHINPLMGRLILKLNLLCWNTFCGMHLSFSHLRGSDAGDRPLWQ